MIERLVTPRIEQRLRRFPSVAIVGPRQCGKTTLAKSLGGAYFDLEQPDERLRLDLAWDELVAKRKLMVLDEAHAWPDVFPRLRGAIDARRKVNGRFLLLGSIAPSLMMHVSESLAGRLSTIELSPLLTCELPAKAQRERHWLTGGFPDGGVLSPSKYPQWQHDYTRVLAQRDLPAWGLPAKPQLTERFMAMVAALNGQIWNASDIGRNLGMAYHTTTSYLDYLEGAFLVRRLPPFTPNIAKRLVKRPKVAWRDSGLMHAILGVEDRRALLRQPWVGASWESFVIEQITGMMHALGRHFSAYHFRTSDGYELDLVIETKGEIWGFEVKLTSAPSPSDFKRLTKVADMAGVDRCVLVSNVAKSTADGKRVSCNVADLFKYLKKW